MGTRLESSRDACCASQVYMAFCQAVPNNKKRADKPPVLPACTIGDAMTEINRRTAFGAFRGVPGLLVTG